MGGVDVALNLLLFIPLGVGLRLRGLSVARSTLVAFAVSLSVESWQYLVVTGRDPTISDVLTNTTGGGLGALLAATGRLWLLPTSHRATALTVGAAGFTAVVLIATAIGLQPSIEPRLYYAQIEPRVTDGQVFSGRLLSTELNGRAVTHEGELQGADGTPWAVLAGGEVRLNVALLPGPKLVGKAPILRITNSTWEAAALVQERDALVFRARTRAVDARLAGPGLAVAGVLPATPAGMPDTVLGQAVLEPERLRLDISRGGVGRSYFLPLRVTLGWMFLNPYFTLDHRLVPWASAAWLAALLVPVGFWAARASLSIGIVATVAVGVLLNILPMVAHLSATGPLEWVGGTVGFGGGVYFARLVDARFGRRATNRGRKGGVTEIPEIGGDAVPAAEPNVEPT